MAQPKLKMNYPLCTKNIACDGEAIKTGREMCGRCEQALHKRNKTTKLRGQQYIDYNIQRNREIY